MCFRFWATDTDQDFCKGKSSFCKMKQDYWLGPKSSEFPDFSFPKPCAT